MKSIVVFQLAAAALFACSSRSLDRIQPNKGGSETQRPTDGSEGVPGYLTDPELLTAKDEDSNTVVSGSPGAVTLPQESEEETIVSAYEVSADDLAKTPKSESGKTEVAGKRLGSSAVAADGSFTIQFPKTSKEYLVLSVIEQSSDAKVTIFPNKEGRAASAMAATSALEKFRFLTVEDFVYAEDTTETANDDKPTTSPTPTPEPQPTPEPEDPSPTCGGKTVSGSCWYLGSMSASCSATCQDRGGYDEATKSFAGSGGSLANCLSVMKALGAAGISGGSRANEIGLGCTSSLAILLHSATPATTADAFLPLFQRACACKQ